MQAQTEPQTSPSLSSARFTCAGSMCDGSSTGISTVSKPHFLKVLKSFVLSLVNGEVNKKVLMPNLITGKLSARLVERQKLSKDFEPASSGHAAREFLLETKELPTLQSDHPVRIFAGACRE